MQNTSAVHARRFSPLHLPYGKLIFALLIAALALIVAYTISENRYAVPGYENDPRVAVTAVITRKPVFDKHRQGWFVPYKVTATNVSMKEIHIIHYYATVSLYEVNSSGKRTLLFPTPNDIGISIASHPLQPSNSQTWDGTFPAELFKDASRRYVIEISTDTRGDGEEGAFSAPFTVKLPPRTKWRE